MRRALGLAWASLFVAALGVASASAAVEPPRAAQRIVSSEVAEGRDGAALELALEGGVERAVRFERNLVVVDGRTAGRYEPGGALERAWRGFLGRLSETAPDFRAAEAAYREFLATTVTGAEAEALAAVREALRTVAWSASTPARVAATATGQTGDTAARTDTAARARDTAREAPTPSDRRRGRRPARGGVIIEIESLGDVVGILDDFGLDRSSILVERLERLRTPIKVVAFYSRYDVPAGDTLESSLLLWDTNGEIAGVIRGDLVVVRGDVDVVAGGVVEGDVLAVDADVDVREGKIGGAVAMLEGTAVLRDLAAGDRAREIAQRTARTASERMARRVFHNVMEGVQGFFGTLGFWIFFGLLGVFTVYFLRDKLEVVADTVSVSFGRSLLVGLAAEVIFPVANIVLFVLVVTWLVLPLYLLAMLLGFLFGYLAVAYAAGTNLLRQPGVAQRLGWQGPYARLLVGLGLLLGLFALASLMMIGGDLLGVVFGLLIAAAVLITWVAATAGLGAVILSRFGTRRDFAGAVAAGPPPVPAPAGSASEGGGDAG